MKEGRKKLIREKGRGPSLVRIIEGKEKEGREGAKREECTGGRQFPYGRPYDRYPQPKNTIWLDG